MTDDRDNGMPETLLPQDVEPPRSASSSILDTLDIAGVGEIDIVFERPANHPRLAKFD